MKKPNYHFFRWANFLADTHGMSNAAVGALVRLNAHAWQRWQPERDPFPFLPNDEALLAQLCGNGRSWQQVREQVLAKLTLEDGKRFYAPHREDARSLAGAHKKKAARTAKRKSKPAKQASTVKPEPQQTHAEALEEQAIKEHKEAPAAPAQPWDVAPAPEAGKLVWGLQGLRAVGSLDKLLRKTLRETDCCVLWQVTDTGVKQEPVSVFKDRDRFALKLASGQILTAN